MPTRTHDRSTSSRGLRNGIVSKLIGAVALLAALTIAPAWASVGKGDVGPKELEKGAVTAPKIAKKAVKTGKLEKQAVKKGKLADQAVTRAKLADEAVDGSKVEDGSLTGAKINQLSLDFQILQRRLQGECPQGQAIRAVAQGGELTCEAVQTTGSPTGPAGGDLAGTYPNPQIAAGAVGTANLADNSVDSAKIADGSVGLADLANDSVNSQRVVDGSLTGDDIDQSTLDFWSLAGNAGTDPASDFLGTTDATPLNLRVNDARALRLEPASDGFGERPNVIGGSAGNFVGGGGFGAAIGGGHGNAAFGSFPTVGGGLDVASGPGAFATAGGGISNTASADSSTVGGGGENEAGGLGSTVSGGGGNQALGEFSTVGGGDTNTASFAGNTVAGGFDNTTSGIRSTVGGGASNTASEFHATIAGGQANTAGGSFATIPGGRLNSAQGARSFAAGNRAKANDDGAFVWADSSNFDFPSTVNDEFSARAVGGVRFVSAIDGSGEPTAGVTLAPGDGAWAALSDRRAKREVMPVSSRTVLRKLARMPVSSWSYRSQDPGIRHIGPMAQDFHRAFGLGDDRRRISTIDADGVALAAIKSLNSKVIEQERRIARLEARLPGS